MALATVAAAEPPLVLLVQPLPRDERTAESVQPFARYLETVTGRAWVLEIPPNFPAYWAAVRRHSYDFALDTPYFTDYRLQKLGFSVLVKSLDTASYTLIVRDTKGRRDPGALVGKRIASLGLLSIGTLRLNGIFPNPLRQPVIIETDHAQEAIDMLLGKKVEAAFLPTTRIPEHPREHGLALVLTTEPVARLAFSAAPRVAGETLATVQSALLSAPDSDLGRSGLTAAGVTRFEPATAEDFVNQGNVLKGYWGY